MTPVFTHNCANCQFLGHFYGMDVYYCKHAISLQNRGSLLARHGNEGASYFSTDVTLFQDSIKNTSIRVREDRVMPFQEYLFSEYVLPQHKAFMVALVLTFGKD